MPRTDEQTKCQGKKRFRASILLGAALSLIACWLILCLSITNLSISEAHSKWVDDWRAIDKFRNENQPQANTPEDREHFEEVQRRIKQTDDKLQEAIQAANSRQGYLLTATAGVLLVGSLAILFFGLKSAKKAQSQPIAASRFD
jgi:hypothetical protein